MKPCEICQKNNGNFSAVVGDFYYKSICYECKNEGSAVSSGHARWSRGIDVEDHEGEIAQPWGADGKPNPLFIKLYPTQAAAVFSEQELRDANR